MGKNQVLAMAICSAGAGNERLGNVTFGLIIILE